jgi:hypothetical protein
MKSLKRVLSNEGTFFGALVFIFVLRVVYALSRDLFLSGPDAPFYAQAPLDFVKYGFWSSLIEGAPFYPLGYPAALWPLAEVGGTKWIMLAQVIQILASISTVYFVYRISQMFLSNELSKIISFVFLFGPAFIPMSGQAMYEPTLMFAFYLYLYLILKVQSEPQNYYALACSGILAGFAAVIHPRVIPWIFVVQIILLAKLGLKRGLGFFSFFLAPIIPFLIRNKTAHDVWTLSEAGGYWTTGTFLGNLGTLIKNGFWNAVYFWSPYSGDAKRGTWFHNFTFYHEIKKITQSTTFVILIATIFALVSIIAWLLGSVLIIKSKMLIGSIILYVPLIAWATDFLTIGDSRHRLTVVPLLLIGQIYAFAWLQKKMFHKRSILRTQDKVQPAN